MPAAAPLARMKSIALGLLLAAGALYLLASLLRTRHPAWGYVAAFSEAAMVGAIADWFAVVALFRRPLGLPIPHTAVIPTHKDRIGANLATFLCANFLGTAQLLDRIERLGVAARLARWLGDAAQASTIATQLAAALRQLLHGSDGPRARAALQGLLLEPLRTVDLARLAGRLLEALPAGLRQTALDGLLGRLAGLLENDALKVRLAELMADELKVLRVVGLDNVAGRYATGKIVSGIARLVDEMAHDPAHPLRLEFDAAIAAFVVRLEHDPALRVRVEAAQHALLAHPALLDGLEGLWVQLRAWLLDDLANDDSLLRAHTGAWIARFGQALQRDDRLQRWLDAQLLAAAPRWIERYREQIRLYIVARVGNWNAVEMTDELERNVGRDLQFIRINGTLVGGIAGLAIYTLTRLVQGT
jgi:uncharacterized membrane-anchored protein YjiN (DUF445 family)